MTAVFVFAALIVVNAVYCIYDGRSEEAARQMDDFYRVEFKKNYGAREDALTRAGIDLQNRKRMASAGPFFCCVFKRLRLYFYE